MSEQLFSLIPFPAPEIPDITITGHVSRQNNVMSLHCSVAGKIEDMILPQQSVSPGRRDDLWNATCFEFFLAGMNQPQYWEFNLSPSGDWNVYRIDAYRRVGFREEAAISQLPFEFKRASRAYTLDVSVDLTPMFGMNQELEIAVTAVCQTKDGSETYYALCHPASQPDFHLRESFILSLAGQTHPSGRSVPAV
jgi:hypothetical protein